MPRNDQAIRQLVILNKLEASRHGLTLNQLAEAIDPAATRHPRTLRRDLAAIESARWSLFVARSNLVHINSSEAFCWINAIRRPNLGLLKLELRFRQERFILRAGQLKVTNLSQSRI